MAPASRLSTSPSWGVLPITVASPGHSFACNLSSQNEDKIVVACSGWYNSRYIFDTHTQIYTWLPPSETSSIAGVTCLGNTIFLVRSDENPPLVESITLDQEGNPDDQQGWQLLPSVQLPRRVDCATVVVDGNIFIIGGRDDQSCLERVEKFDVSNRTWTSLSNMTEPRARCAATTIGNKVFVFGGSDDQAIAKNTAEFLDLHAGTWQRLPTMPCCSEGAAAVAVGQFIFLIGGRDENHPLDRVDCFNTVTYRWMDALPPLNTPRHLCCAAASDKGEVFVFGGDYATAVYLDTVERIKIIPFYVLVPKLQNLFQQEDLLLGLWSFILAKRPSDVVFHILLSDRFQLDSVLHRRLEEKMSIKKSKISEQE